jgi:hypothetical protein
VTNPPSNANAEFFSKKFNWSIYNILMITHAGDEAIKNECWLKDINDLQEAEVLLQRCYGQTVFGVKLHCLIEEDNQDLCKEFRLGQCRRSNDDCNWTHITCSVNGSCSNMCPYGHPKGEKNDFSKNGKRNCRIGRQNVLSFKISTAL